MIPSWLGASLGAIAMSLLSAVGIYVSVILLTRLAGLRSFSKMSSFDFAITVAIGTVVASTLLTKDPPLLQGALGLAFLYGIQMTVAYLRTKSERVRNAVDNAPLLLMAGSDIIDEHMQKAKVTEADLIAKLREANVIDLNQVRAVVMESTGDISVLHGAPDGPELQERLLEGVIGRELWKQRSTG